MPTSQTKQFKHLVRHAVTAMLLAGMVSACGGEDKADAGSEDDAGRTPRDAGSDAASGRDSGVDASSEDDPDASEDEVDARAPADAATGDARVGDAATGPIDPIVAGNDAPTITSAGYFQDDLGLRVLIKGRDPNGDIASYSMKLFRGTTAATTDDDNDPTTPGVGTFTNTIKPTPDEAGFFVVFEPTEVFAGEIDTLEITVTDAGGRTSEPTRVTRRATPVATSACDPYGFDRCNGNNVCTNTGNAFRCTPVAGARTTACSKALVLDPASSSKLTANLPSYSLWDAPMGCSFGDLKLQSDVLVKVKLASAAGKVTLSTNNPGSNFDTVLYQLTTCSAQPPACETADCACADDIIQSGTIVGNKSELVLRNVPKGDLLVVVDSRNAVAGITNTFELSVLVE